MIWNQWRDLWHSGLSACKALGGDIRDLRIEAAAPESAIKEVEVKLGKRLPESMRRVFQCFSASIEYNWHLPDEVKPPAPFNIFGCACYWDLSLLIQLEESRKLWVTECFPDIKDAYDAVWHNKLAFMEVGNGDLLALDTAREDGSPVIYLSHDDGEGHGYRLGNDFEDFINRWSMLGCPGPEDWQMWPFFDSSQSGLQPMSKHADQWRQWFGLRL